MAKVSKTINLVGKESAKETLNLIDRDLKKYKQDIDKILGKLQRWDRRLSNENKELYLKEAYIKIMEFRTYLLGEDNRIQYRLYIRDDKNNDLTSVQIVNINEEQLMSIVNRDGTSLRLKRNLDAVKKEQYQDFKRQQVFNKHMGNISKGLEHPSRSPNNYVVTQGVIEKYAKTKQYGKNGKLLAIGLSNLAYQEDNKAGKSAYTLKLFNRGWIYQAFDATVEEFDQKTTGFSENVSLDEFHKKYFTESLDYDNVVGFKGGDVGLTQIKANMAALMSKTTLIKYLKIIQNALDMKIKGVNVNSEEELANYLLSHFMTGKIEKIQINYAIQQIDNAIKNLTN